MANQTAPHNGAENNAQKYFKKAEQSDTTAKNTRKKERADHAAKTARLRALRLAKETADKQAADKQAAENPGAKTDKTRRKRNVAAKPAAIRMIY